MYSIGIDSGSRMTKFCLFDVGKQAVIAYHLEESRSNHEEQIEQIIKKKLLKYQIDRSLIKSIICTGYGRKNYSKSTKYTSEIICHAAGVYQQNKSIRTVIDIGGQDSKIIRMSEQGKVIDFQMNDKCAAGSGRFIEKVAEYFKIEIDEMSDLSEKSDKNIEISSTCVVFSESEIIGLVSAGEKKENIINAVHNSIVQRILGMSGGLGIEYPIAFVGGVAKNKGMVRALGIILGGDVYVPEMPEFTGALGAARIIDNGIRNSEFGVRN